MHMISKKDLSDAEMYTLTKSCSPTIVITANGEVQTHEEPIVYVKGLEKFLTMKVLDNTPAVLSLGKLCDENGYSYEWINGQKTHLILDGTRIICKTENFVPIVVPGLSSSSSGSSSTLRTPMKQESHSSSSSSSSSPTVGEIRTFLQCQCLNRLMMDQGNLMKSKPTKTQNQIKRKPRSRQILRSRNGCKNSGKIWWMMKFHYSSHAKKFLQSRLQRDVRIWVNTVFKTEIARSVKGPKLQGPHAQDAMAKPYLEPQILVT